MAKKKVPVNYTSRDFASIKQDLVDYAKRYYPDTYQDFKEVSFGSLMLDTVAYVGDILSFYVDYQANETFIDSAAEYKNVIRLAKQYGYKFNSNPSSTGIVEFYLVIPANNSGMGPDINYLPILKEGSSFSATNGVSFLLIEPVDFSNPNNEIVVGKVDPNTGTPLSFAVRTTGRVLSGKIITEIVPIERYERFLRVPLGSQRVSEIISVFDEDGNEYYQVDYLSQDVIYKGVTNRAQDKYSVPMVLRPYSVPRRFTLEADNASSFLQFGFGSDDEDATISPVDPSNIVLDMHARGFISATTFDPSKLLASNKLGVAPANTTLRITYRVNSVGNINAPAGTLTNVMNPLFSFRKINRLSQPAVGNVINSLELTNVDPILGDIENPTTEEIRIRTKDFFATQNRAVTKKDYEAIIYSMPAKYGKIKRCNIIQDPDSFKRNLNLYVLSENVDGNLIASPQSLKENLKIWLNQYKMINDTIDILDGYIINIGIDFEVYVDPDINKFDVLSSCISALSTQYSSPLVLGEPFYITDVYTLLNSIRGVVDTKKVKISLKTGSGYADTSLSNLEELMSADGRYVRAPVNVVLEIKNPAVDIKGSTR